MKAELTMIEGESAGRKVLIQPNGKVILGRHHLCEVILNDTNVSRLHTLVLFSTKGSSVVDLGSTSGTYLNDRRIEKSALIFGDEIRVGNNVFKFLPTEQAGEQEKKDTLKGKVEPTEIDSIAGVCKNCSVPVPKSQLPMSIAENDAARIFCPNCLKLDKNRCRHCDQFVTREDIALGKGVCVKNKYFCEEHLPLGKEAPEQIAQYKLLTPLGGGSVSNVYKARHLFIGTLVAIKLMRPKLAKHKSIIERFFREARFGVRFDHSNMVRIYDAGQADKYFYLVMEFFDGETLYETAAKKPFSISQVIQIARQLCDAVAYAHSWGVVHRDIKPSNVLIAPTGEIKLTDLGAAKEWENPDSSNLTQQGQFIGTLRYQPPEQIANASKVDHRADIYAIGSCLYYCLTGKPPFEGKTLAEMLDKVLGGNYIKIEQMIPDIPEPLKEMITLCLQKQADKRPQTIQEVQTFLNQL